MAAARKTTSTTRSTSTSETKATEDAKVTDDATKEAAVQAAEEAIANQEEGKVVEAETEVVKNPVLDGGKDVTPDDEKADADKAAEDREKEHEEARKVFNEGAPTSEAYQDPHVNLADLPVHHDPVVSDDHAVASHAAEVDNQKLIAAAPVQVSQMDSSSFGVDVTDSLSFTVEPKGDDSDDKKADDKK